MADWEQAAGATGGISVLLTGYGPFPGITINESARLVGELTRCSMPGVAITSVILPTEWQAGPKALGRALKAVRPDIALHFGVAPGVTGFRIETVGENRTRATNDACGSLPGGERLLRFGPSHLAATLPCDAILTRLHSMGLQAELSTDAGRYLCNAALYRSLHLSRRAKRPWISGFIHLPAHLPDRVENAAYPASSLQPLAWPTAITGAAGIIEVCLAHVRALGNVVG